MAALLIDPINPEGPRPFKFTRRGTVRYEPEKPGDPAWEQREYARMVAAATTLAGFIRWIWPIINPGRALVWGPHLDVVCYALEQLAFGNIEGNEMVINIPPRHLKSVTVSVAFPAWLWLYAPWVQTLGVSAAEKISVRDTKAMRRIVQHPKYQKLVAFCRDFLGSSGYNAPWELTKDQNQKMRFENTAGGYRVGLAAGAQIIGEGADLFIVDDPLDAKTAKEGGHDVIMANMAKVIERYGGVWHSRLNNPETSIRVVIMQRLHEADLAGWLLAAGVPCVVLPTEYNPEHPYVCEYDWRTEPGELLLEERLSEAVIKRMKGPGGWSAEDYAAQHGQLPVPAGGGMFPEKLWRYYDGSPEHLYAKAKHKGRVFTTYDVASKTGDRNAYTVCYVMARLQLLRDLYVLAEYREKVELSGLLRMFDQINGRWQPYISVIEDASHGTSLIQMRQRTHRIESVSPQQYGGKAARAGYTEARLKEGTLHLPQAAIRPWVKGLIHEHTMFPKGRFMDRVDALSQGCLYADAIEGVGQRGSATTGLQWLKDVGRASGFEVPEW